MSTGAVAQESAAKSTLPTVTATGIPDDYRSLNTSTASAWAQSASATLPTVEVQASNSPDSQAAEALKNAREELNRRAGATAVIDAQSYTSGRAATAVDALAYAPGVLAQTRHGQDARLSIRGSGIQRSFLMRGIQLYQDGIPLNQTDGAADFQSIDPAALQYIEVWRGANALEYGANGLGGAINFVSPTGLTAPTAALRVQAGSFGQRQAQANLAARGEAVDGFLSVSRGEQDGWRDQSGYRADRLSGNISLRLSDTLELRGFLSYVDSTMQMPGSISLAAMNANPRQAGTNYAALKATNDYTQKRAALRLTWQPSADVRWTTSLYGADRDRYHAMTVGILQQDMQDTGLDSRVAVEFGTAALTRRLVAGVSFARLDGEERRNANVAGSTGAATGRTQLDGRQNTVYAEYTHGLNERWALQAGVQSVQARRRLDNLMNPAASYDVKFNGTSPKLGVLYTASPQSQWFANISGSFEAAPFGEVAYNATNPLARAQGATTVELGWRGRTDQWTWDAALYRSNVRRELLAMTNASGVALGTVNADRTIHQGLELSATGTLAPGWVLRGQYLYNDFRFDGDAVYGNKRLAGVPPHLLRAELQWQAAPWIKVAPSLDWQPSRTWIDHANTVAADGFALLNLTLSGTLRGGWGWFVEGRNLTDRRYAATTAAQANARGLDGAYYFPGDGRSVYAGLTWRTP
ncbi:TonB-dependent receptor [Comamonas testosteroni]|uniref:TonB-dependent receptor family protein n=1 Tax=Comamonas testosteroni TaxID=285 RepID=UPI0023AA36F5|nr:TonB-dependent receptor [Comamonas testosteroni]WEE77023.1 TonB-dependent receptor [Comamonas testosteroni]